MKIFFSLLISLLPHILFAQEVSARYELVKMDKTVNTFHHEAAPVISPDGKTLYFFVMNHPENTMGKEDTQDIWFSRKDENGTWSPAEHAKAPLNIHRSNQVFTVFDDGSLFVKGGSSKGEKGLSLFKNGRLTELDVPELKAMNKGRFYGATMSADMKHIILYFSEKDNSTISDLYATHLQSDGKWTVPAKLKLSSPQDDVGPFIGPDQKTLYFASAMQAPGRQGGVDIYKATRTDDTWTNWSAPVNVGKPVNTSALDFYFTIDRDGNVFTSRANKAVDGAQLDLYMMVPKVFNVRLRGTTYHEKTMDPVQANVEIAPTGQEALKLLSNSAGKFEKVVQESQAYAVRATATGFLPKELKLTLPLLEKDTIVDLDIPLTPIARKLILTGNVFDVKTGKKLDGTVDVVAKADRKIRFPLKTSQGSFEKEIPKLGWYMLTASAEGYLRATDSIEFESEELTPLSRDLYLTPIEVGLTVRLKNINFDFDKTTLKRESFTELNRVVDFLNQNPSVEIEIAGHTDSKGSDDYNLNLSQGRTESVVRYLVEQGISEYRLTARGYGETKPIDSNDTDEGRANNRRVEFTVLKK